MRKISLLAMFCLVTAALHAQQASMYTKYMFNQLAYNPAYAGSADALDAVLLHRHQWVSMGPDAPMTQNFTLHSPIQAKNIGLGLNMTYDRVPTQKTFAFYPSFSYRMKFGDPQKQGGYISLGLQGGVSNFRADYTGLDLDNPNDPAFQNQQPNLWLPNFGTGIYVQTKTWFVGLSSPMLITNALRKRTAVDLDNTVIAQQFRHYYLTGGAAFKLTEDITFRPTIMIKNIGLFVEKNIADVRRGAPNTFDIDAAFLFKKRLWLGVAFRSAFELNTSSYDSVDFWASLRLNNGLRIGAAFDYTISGFSTANQGSYEIMLGYDMLRLDESKVVHVRYF